jgi:hypothetical protein
MRHHTQTSLRYLGTNANNATLLSVITVIRFFSQKSLFLYYRAPHRCMVPKTHFKLRFCKGSLTLAQIARDWCWKGWRLFRASPLLVIGLVLLWGGMFVAWKFKALIMTGEIIWAIGFIMFTVGIRLPKR